MTRSAMMDRSLHGRVVVITGASAGLGRATALAFARLGASIGLIARDAAALEEVAAEVSAVGGRAIAMPCDVADAAAVAMAAERAEHELGAIAIWINCAMVTVFSPLWSMSAEEFRRVTEVTYLGFVHGTMAALQHMRPRDHGTIVQVGSSLAYRGIPLQSAYCGAKHAIRGFTDALRSELIHDDSSIRLVMVQMPAMNTPQFDWARTHMPRKPRPVAPVIQPEAAARAIVAAATGSSREIWVGLSTVKVILGSIIAPGFLDRFLARHAFEGQERPDSVSPQRRDNLLQPVHRLHRTHGDFDSEARPFAIAVTGQSVRASLFLLAISAFAGSLLLGLSMRRRSGSED